MSKRTRTHRPTTASPRYTKAHGIGLDRVRWPSGKFRMPFRHLPDSTAAVEVETIGDAGKYEADTDG